jgi:hypothetical protein
VRRERRDRRQFVDEARHFLGRDLERPGAVMLDGDRPARLAGLRGGHLDLHAGAEPAQDIQERRPRRIQPDIVDADLRAGQRRGGHEPERRGREVAGDAQRLRAEALAAGDRDREAVDVDRAAEGAQRALRMVARRRGLDDRRRARRVQAGEQDGALHLRARRLGAMLDGVQRPAVDPVDPVDNNRGVAVGGLDPCAHAFEGGNHAPHRAPGQRRIADEGRGERMAGQHAGEQPQRRAGIPGVERRRGRTELAKPSSQYNDGASRPFRNLDTELPQARQRGPAVGPGGEVGKGRPAVRERRQQGVPVGDRLIAGDAQAAAEALGGRNRRGGRQRH